MHILGIVGLSILLLFVLFVGFYLLAVFFFQYIPIHIISKSSKKEIQIWVISNGAHTEIVFPIYTTVMDWTNFIDFGYFKSLKPSYISFGWGDKGFFLDTPTWAELKPSTAIKAFFRMSSSAIQVIVYEQIPENKWVKSLYITPENYEKIIQKIQADFAKNAQNLLIPIDFVGMPAYDHLDYKFFEANGRYHFLKTCNCWANNLLKIAEVKTAVWTPFAHAIFYQLEKKRDKTDF